MMRAYLVDDEPLAVKRLARMLLATWTRRHRRQRERPAGGA
jgi:hypothetical protein